MSDQIGGYFTACAGKLGHPNAEAARTAARIATRYSRDKRPRLDVYRCRYCNKWHIGSGRKR